MRIAHPRHAVRTLAVGLVLPLAAARAQWRVVETPASAGRQAEVTAMVRERSDSLADDAEAIALVVRCRSRQLDAFLTTRDELESDLAADVRVRVDSDSVRPIDTRWQATRAGTGAFIPSSDLRELIQRRLLRPVPELRISAVTQRRGRVTWTFAATGFEPALGALREACPGEQRGALALPRR
ncbi:MAG: hypothetical protein IT355_09320 [Gemmatimonadaceae bacterium]|nr:hypothetical protein [Gemmatimonadaceae bacterium]